jgi:hypothetical protein
MIIKKDELVSSNSSMIISQTLIKDSLSLMQGGTIYVDDEFTNVTIDKSNIINTEARYLSGGFSAIKKIRIFNITGTTVVNSQSPDGRIMIVESQSNLTNVSIS